MALPVTLKLPVVVTFAPFPRKKFPETLVKPVSALLLLVAPASATRAFAPSSAELAIDRRDLSRS